MSLFASQLCPVRRAVHDDVFKVIKYSFDETLGADMAARCTQLWCTFVEPMFGLPARPLHQTEKVLKARYCLTSTSHDACSMLHEAASSRKASSSL